MLYKRTLMFLPISVSSVQTSSNFRLRDWIGATFLVLHGIVFGKRRKTHQYCTSSQHWWTCIFWVIKTNVSAFRRVPRLRKSIFGLLLCFYFIISLWIKASCVETSQPDKHLGDCYQAWYAISLEIDSAETWVLYLDFY